MVVEVVVVIVVDVVAVECARLAPCLPFDFSTANFFTGNANLACLTNRCLHHRQIHEHGFYQIREHDFCQILEHGFCHIHEHDFCQIREHDFCRFIKNHTPKECYKLSWFTESRIKKLFTERSFFLPSLQS